MRNGSFSCYYNVSSPIHSLSPLCKLLALFVFVIMTFIGSNISVMCSLFLVLMFLIVISNVPFYKYLNVIFFLSIFCLFVFVLNLCFCGFYDSIIMISRICLVVLYLSILLYTTTINEISYGLSLLLKPLSYFKVPVFKISLYISLFLNFIPCLFSEAGHVIKSQKSRGFDYSDVSFIDKIKGIFPAFILSLRRTFKLFEVLKVRFSNDYFSRNSIYDFRFRLCDIYMISCHVIIFTFILIKEVVL